MYSKTDELLALASKALQLTGPAGRGLETLHLAIRPGT